MTGCVQVTALDSCRSPQATPATSSQAPATLAAWARCQATRPCPASPRCPRSRTSQTRCPWPTPAPASPPPPSPARTAASGRNSGEKRLEFVSNERVACECLLRSDALITRQLICQYSDDVLNNGSLSALHQASGRVLSLAASAVPGARSRCLGGTLG